MTWVPVIILLFRYIAAMLEAIAAPESVKMFIKTADGKSTFLPCNVTPKGTGSHEAKITAKFMSTGVPVITAEIHVGGRVLSRAHMGTKGQQLYTTGPVEL